MKKQEKVNSFFTEMNDLAQEFPAINDYEGSVGAIVRLHFAYQMNLTELSDNNKIKVGS